MKLAASIQPQPCSRGTHGHAQARAVKASVEARAWLQFSRNLAVAEHVQAVPNADLGECASIQPQPCSRGTRAAATNPQTPRPPASIQPQPCSRGTLGPGSLPAAGPMASIQPQPCSRGTRREGRRADRAPSDASIQPQPCSRGTLGNAAVGELRHGASIQPQPCSRGTLTIPAGPVIAEALLQFSRNLAVAEHGVQVVVADDRADASIQPQPCSRGTRLEVIRESSQNCAPSGFNSAATLQSRNTFDVP